MLSVHFSSLSLPPGELPSLDSYVKGPFYSRVLLYYSHCFFPLRAFIAQCVLYTYSLHLSTGPKEQHGREPGVLVCALTERKLANMSPYSTCGRWIPVQLSQ